MWWIKSLFILSYILCLQYELKAQISSKSRTIHRSYFTQYMNNEVGEKDKRYQSALSKMERELANKKSQNQPKKIIVPVVFHILYNSSQPYPSEEQIWWQLNMLNQDFAASKYNVVHPADTLEGFKKKVADTEITFCVPARAGNGKKEIPGIHYVETQRREWGANWEMTFTELSGVDAVDPNKYLNVWVVNLADSVSGWATYPFLKNLKNNGTNTDFEEGIVIGFKFFGQDEKSGGTADIHYNEGKTLTHLTGNYLGLYDLWNVDHTCADDYVNDTPIHNAPNIGCHLYKHISTCYGKAVEMIMNFMDNSDDACQRMFTFGQKLRMQAMFVPGGPRFKLLNTPVDCSIELPLDNNLQFRESSEITNTIPAETSSALTLKIWPIPAKETTTLEIKTPAQATGQEQIEIMIYTPQGQLQKRIPANLTGRSFRTVLDVSDWPAGVYWAFVYTTSGMARGSFVVQH